MTDDHRESEERPSQKKAPLIIFHRANSLAACRHAINLKCKMLEFDVRRTKDDEIVVFHDPDIDGVLLSDLTYLELKDMALSHHNVEVPTLEDLLKVTQGKIKLDVELKEGGYEKEVLDMVLQYFEPDEIVATSFVHPAVRAIKDNFPDVQAGLLLGKSYFVKYSDVFPGRRFAATKADFIAPNYRLFRLGVLQRAFRKGVPVFVWTVNKKRILRKFMKDSRVDGIITDNLRMAFELQKRQTRIIQRKQNTESEQEGQGQTA